MFSSKPSPEKLSRKMAAAIRDYNVDAFMSLLAAPGADPNVRAGEDTLLSVVIKHSYTQTFLEPLIKAGLKVSIYDVMSASYGKDTYLVHRLIQPDLDLDIDAGDSEGYTCLHKAVRYGSKEVVAELIKGGINLNILTAQGNTALHMATLRSTDSRDILEMLLNAGADPNIKNDAGATAADMLQREHPRIAQFVRSHMSVAQLPQPQATKSDPKTALALVGDDDAAWKQLDHLEIAHVSDKSAIGFSLTEIFNFDTRVYIGITKDHESKMQSQTIKSFDELEGTLLIEKAAEALIKKGVSGDLLNGYVTRKHFKTSPGTKS